MRASSSGDGTQRKILRRSVGARFSALVDSSSNSFSPGRVPTILIGISTSVKPDRRMSWRARSMIFTGSPMSRRKTSPLAPSVPAWSTRFDASGMVMK